MLLRVLLFALLFWPVSSRRQALRLRGGMVIHSLADVKKEVDAQAGGLPSAAMAGPVDGEKLSTSFMGIHHEKQIGGLCAVHCINNLIQAPEFDEIQVSHLFAPACDGHFTSLLTHHIQIRSDSLSDSTCCQHACGQLAEIAGDMDRRERAALAGSGLESESGNVRADGFFSVQVCDALCMQILHHQCMFMCSAGCLRIGRLGNGIGSPTPFPNR